MKYLNLGCGFHYSTQSEWTNLDFVSTGKEVIAHNLLKGIPFDDNSFDLIYHSHLLEHFSKEDGRKIIEECFRVLKPGGTIRIAIPDLEMIVKNYLLYLEKGVENPDDEIIRANYDWMVIEMYDQTVRSSSGGRMLKKLSGDIVNEDFIFERIGEEGKSLRKHLKLQENIFKENIRYSKNLITGNIYTKIKKRLKKYLLKKLGIDEQAMELGKFRLSGEIHQWMYDRYSLSNLLKRYGGKDIQVKTAFTSNINNWVTYNLDVIDSEIRKPDSLFMEAIK